MNRVFRIIGALALLTLIAAGQDWALSQAVARQANAPSSLAGAADPAVTLAPTERSNWYWYFPAQFMSRATTDTEAHVQAFQECRVRSGSGTCGA